ncbi:hypothetical protein B0H10DRAFT_1952984 [Mycena sp. CBHHK59/15]|nr:hypothetical protein B0H10DRAFT_1952984 [Mycena sp. CBHHK59/15]
MPVRQSAKHAIEGEICADSLQVSDGLFLLRENDPNTQFTALTAGVQTVRIDSAFRVFRQLDGCEDVGGFGLEVGGARHEDDARGIAGCRGGQQFWGKQLGEKEWPDVICTKLAFQAINGELERTSSHSKVPIYIRVLDPELDEYQAFAVIAASNVLPSSSTIEDGMGEVSQNLGEPGIVAGSSGDGTGGGAEAKGGWQDEVSGGLKSLNTNSAQTHTQKSRREYRTTHCLPPLRLPEMYHSHRQTS